MNHRTNNGHRGAYTMQRVRKGKYIICSDGSIISEYRKVLKPQNARGYDRVRIQGKLVYVHRMIAEAFISNPDNKPEVNHKNGNKRDNRASNLEWCTRAENIQHADKTGLRVMPSGSNHWTQKNNLNELLTA